MNKNIVTLLLYFTSLVFVNAQQNDNTENQKNEKINKILSDVETKNYTSISYGYNNTPMISDLWGAEVGRIMDFTKYGFILINGTNIYTDFLIGTSKVNKDFNFEGSKSQVYVGLSTNLRLLKYFDIGKNFRLYIGGGAEILYSAGQSIDFNDKNRQNLVGRDYWSFNLIPEIGFGFPDTRFKEYELYASYNYGVNQNRIYTDSNTPNYRLSFFNVGIRMLLTEENNFIESLKKG